MEGFLGGAYPWVKAFHLIAVIFWMAGMFMMPRFFAYHAEENATHGVGSPIDQTWRERERRLMRIIVNPSMMLAWLLGLALAFNIGWDSGGWLHAKVAIVLLLSAYHGMLSRWRKAFAAGNNPRTTRFYRMINELPTLAVVVIVILVIVKPF